MKTNENISSYQEWLRYINYNLVSLTLDAAGMSNWNLWLNAIKVDIDDR